MAKKKNIYEEQLNNPLLSNSARALLEKKAQVYAVEKGIDNDIAPVRSTTNTSKGLSLLNDEDDASLIASGILGNFREKRNAKKQEREYNYINSYVNGTRVTEGMTLNGKKITSQILNKYATDYATSKDNLRVVKDTLTGEDKIVSLDDYKTRDGLENMSAEEITTYNQLYAQSPSKAEAYLDSMQIEFSKRGSDKRLAEQKAKVQDYGKAGAAVWSAMSVPMNVYGGVVNATGQAINKLTGKEYNPYTEGADILNRAGVIRSTVNENLEGHKAAQMAYNAGMSAADNVLNLANASALGAGKIGTQILNSATMGAATFGSTVKELKDAGVDDKKITATGLTRAGIEAALEAVSLDALLTPKAAKSVIGALVKGGLSQAVVEGTTEGLTELATVLADRAILQKDSDTYQRKAELMEQGYSETEAKKQVRKEVALQIAEAAGTGAMAGGAMGGVANAAQQQARYTDNEKAVIEAEVQRRISEQETDDKKLTKKEKAAIEDEVRNDLEKGYISIDSIESALGGDTYNSYKAISEQETALEKELEELKNAPNTVGNSRRYDEVERNLKDLRSNSNKSQIKEQLSKEVDALTKNDTFLRESYNEKSRKGQAFEADLTKYKNEAQKAIIQKAIDSKILNNTRRTHEFVDMISKIAADKGVSFDFTDNAKLKESGFVVDGKTVNGYVQGNNISLNIQSAKSLNKVVGHEITHVLEGTELYSELQKVVKEYATTKGEYDTRLSALQELYKDVRDANIENELTADLIGDYLFTDEKFVNSLSTKNPNIFKKIYEEIKYLVKVATAGTKEAKELERIKKIFEKAYKQVKVNPVEDDTVKFSLRNKNITKNDSILYVVHTSYTNVPPKDFAALKNLQNKVKNIPRDNFENKATGYKADINSTTVGKILNPAPGFDPWNKKFSYIENLNAALHLPELFENAVYIDTKAPQKAKNQGKQIVGYHHFVAPIEMNNGDYRVLITAREKQNSNVLYVVKVEVLQTKRGSQAAGQMPPTISGKPRTITIPDLVNGVNIYDYISKQNKTYTDADIQYSLNRDSDGNSVNENMQLYMKDTKAVDANGALMKVYHGTVREFYTFDRSYANVEGNMGKGFYFTNNVNDVDENYANEKGADLTNKIEREADLLDGMDEYEDMTHEEIVEMLREKYITAGEPITHECYLNITKPCYIGRYNGKPETYLFDDVSEEYDIDDFEDEDEYYYAIEEMSEEYIETAIDAIESNIEIWDERTVEDIRGILNEAIAEGGIRAEDLRKRLDDLYIEDTDGNLVSSEVLRVIIESQGYDGVIDSTVSQKFRNMNLSKDTVHYIVFDSKQAKLTSNQNPTTNPDIRRSLSRKGDIAPIGKYNVYGSDIALDTSEDIAPVRSDIQQKNSEVRRDYKPLTEEQANVRDKERVAAEQGDDHNVPMRIGGKALDRIISDLKETLPFARGKVKVLKGAIQEYSTAEEPDTEKLYQAVKEHFSTGINKTRYNDVAQIHGILRKTEIMVDDFTKRNIPGYEVLRKSNARKVKFSDTGMPIDTTYQELSSQYPDFFPENITNTADQLLQILDVANMEREVTQEYSVDSKAITRATRKIIDAVDAYKKKAVAEQRRKKHSDVQAAYVDEIIEALSEEGMDFDEVLENANNKSTFASVDNTPQRFMEKTFGYRAGQIINRLTINRQALNESKGIEWLNTITNRKDGLLAQLSKQYNIKPGSEESAAAQMYGEGFYVNDKKEYVKYGEEELKKDFPDEQVRANIIGLATDPRVRQFYDETLDKINESREQNGYPAIPKRSDYFLHFRAMDDTFSRLGIPFNPNDIKAKDLPTDLNGVTADLKPGQPYFASANQRKGLQTTYDVLGGMERYANGAKNQIYHIGDIQVLRGLRNVIASKYGQAKGLEKLDELEQEAQYEQIQKVYNGHLSNMAKFLNEQANIIAGKTALIDRGLEGIIGRRGMTVLSDISNQVGKNMVGFNIGSSLTNIISGVQSFAKTNKFDAIKAFSQTIANKFQSDGFTENDPFIIRRKGAEQFYRKPYQKISDTGYIFMTAIDDLMTEYIVRSKYNELTRKNKDMDTEEAHIKAGEWAARLLGDRSMGQMPHLFNSKTLGLFTKFQLEVRNQLDSMFYDTIQEAKAENEDIQNGLARNAKTAAKVTATIAQLVVFQHLFGKAFEAVAGYNPTFDILETIMTAFGFDDEEESEDTLSDNLNQAFLGLVEDLPYTSALTGGRIPIASALPIEELITGTDDYGNEKPRWETLLEALPYYVMPGGYGQLKKTVQGLSMFDDNLPVSGSYTKNTVIDKIKGDSPGNLRFSVEDTIPNKIQAAVFGQWASQNARQYFDEELAPLKEKQVQEYIDSGVSMQEYWDYRQGLSGLSTNAEKSDYIASLDLPVKAKNTFINNVLDRKEEVDMTGYEGYSDFEEFDYAQKNPEKYTVAKAVGGYDAYIEISDTLGSFEADKDENGESIRGTKKQKVWAYIDSLDLNEAQKYILFKSKGYADDSHNYEIIDYLNSRDDISYSEMETILKELDFNVDSEGNISW